MRWFWILLFWTGIAYASDLPAPPPLSTEPAAEQLYFQSIYTNFHKLEQTSTNPNGARKGNTGDMLLYKTSLLKYYFVVNIDGLYHWQAVELGNIL